MVSQVLPSCSHKNIGEIFRCFVSFLCFVTKVKANVTLVCCHSGLLRVAFKSCFPKQDSEDIAIVAQDNVVLKKDSSTLTGVQSICEKFSSSAVLSHSVECL